jgi:hypothetical protein
MEPIEYERRRAFCETVKTMSRPECIEVARILRKHGATMSENRSGLFFDMTKIPGHVFEELLKFHEFVKKNSQELAKRDRIMDTLGHVTGSGSGSGSQAKAPSHSTM